MAKRKGLHKSDKEQYAAYNSKQSREKNRLARAKRHAKNHPNDKQSAAKVKDHRSKANVKGNFPEAKWKLRDPITGQPIAAPAFSEWTGEYSPIPGKRKNAKTS